MGMSRLPADGQNTGMSKFKMLTGRCAADRPLPAQVVMCTRQACFERMLRTGLCAFDHAELVEHPARTAGIPRWYPISPTTTRVGAPRVGAPISPTLGGATLWQVTCLHVAHVQ